MLLEKLVAMTLGLLLSTLLVDALRNQITLRRLVITEAKIVESNYHIDTLIQHALRKLDEHRFPFFPKITKEGELHFSDGTPHPLMLRTDGLGTHPDSDLITYPVLSRTNPTFIRYDEAVCAPLPLLQHALFYDGDTIFEGEVVRGEPLPDGCTSIMTKEFSKSVLFLNDAHTHSMARIPLLYFPLESVVTLYVSRNEILRFAQLRGEDVIENQPLRENSPILHHMDQLDSLGRYTIRVEKSYDNLPTRYRSTFASLFKRQELHPSLLQLQRGERHSWE